MKKNKNMTMLIRGKIEVLYNSGMPVKEIAKIIGYCERAVYTELRKGYYMHTNTDLTETKKYSADKAQKVTDYNNTAKGCPLKLGNDWDFVHFVEHMIIQEHYSPEAVLGYIKEHNLNFKTKVCRATLYSYIENGVFPNLSNKHLLRKKNKKQVHKRKEQKKIIKGSTIEERPKEVLEREEFGHWEMDSVIGKREKGNTIVTLTERKTRNELIFKAKDKTAKSVVKILNTLERAYGKDFSKVFKTITVDNGTEFSAYEEMEKSIYGKNRKRTKIYYCHAYSSWERGSNENQNGFIRRFIPKGTDINPISPNELRYIQDYINTYPRRIFNFANSEKLFLLELDKLLKKSEKIEKTS